MGTLTGSAVAQTVPDDAPPSAKIETVPPAPAESVEQSRLPRHEESSVPTPASAKIEPSVEFDQTAKDELAKVDAPIAPPQEQSGALIDAFIVRLDNATRAIHANGQDNPALIREGCRELLNEVLDLDAMAQAANAELWPAMTPDQRETFRLAFGHRMVVKCVRQFGNYKGEKLQLVGVRKTDSGDLLATVRVGSEEEGKLVTWRLQNSAAHRWRAVDVITEGRSAVLDARTEFAAVLQSVNGDIEALIAVMQR
jgi:ABC-type transporter MlaC component